MQQTIVFTFSCNDRPGLVELLANTVRDHQGNWLESRLSHLGGKFAGIVRVSLAEASVAALQTALAELKNRGISIIISDGITSVEANGPKAVLSVFGHDRPGIVHQVARALATHGINIIQMESQVNSAPMAGTPLFQAEIHIQAPASLSRDAIADELNVLAESEEIDLSLEWE